MVHIKETLLLIGKSSTCKIRQHVCMYICMYACVYVVRYLRREVGMYVVICIYGCMNY